MSRFDAVMGRARLVLKEAEEFVDVNMASAPTSSAIVRDVALSLRDVMSLQFPEMQSLEPIDFGPNDDDRVKDFFEKVFLAEYAHSRDTAGLDYDEALNYADEAAKGSADYYRAWLKEQDNGNA